MGTTFTINNMSGNEAYGFSNEIDIHLKSSAMFVRHAEPLLRYEIIIHFMLVYELNRNYDIFYFCVYLPLHREVSFSIVS